MNGVQPKIHWHNRGYLPHFEGGQIPQSLTFRLYDSLPKELLLKWKSPLADIPESEQNMEITKRIEEFLDRSEGPRWLADERVARIVTQALASFNGERYLLHAWVIMPNHVHVLFTPCDSFLLSSIVHSWKSFTSKQAKKITGLEGKFWQPEYLDRAIRNERHFQTAKEYIEYNPVKSGLALRPDEWPWSSAFSPTK